MAMVFVLGTVVAVPVQTQSNQTHRSSQAPQSLRPVVPSSNQSHNQSRHLLIQISPLSIPVSSGKKTVPSSHKNASLRSAPTPAEKKVEDFAKKLRADIEAQERVLNVYIKTIQDRHTNTQSKLNKVKVILKGLKDEIANATNFANQYQSQDNDLSKQDTLYRAEYEKSKKMYEDEQANIKFEKEFLEQVIKYIQLRKSNCLAK
jgi:hypothetical protein